jgi:hypothetical protein
MLLWVIKQVTMSLVLIAAIHYIYVFFKSNLTTPKVKDLVNKPKKQYEEIYRTMAGEKSAEPGNRMKAELQSYLKSLSKTDESQLPSTAGKAFEGNFSANYETV